MKKTKITNPKQSLLEKKLVDEFNRNVAYGVSSWENGNFAWKDNVLTWKTPLGTFWIYEEEHSGKKWFTLDLGTDNWDFETLEEAKDYAEKYVIDIFNELGRFLVGVEGNGETIEVFTNSYISHYGIKPKIFSLDELVKADKHKEDFINIRTKI
jgi:hypothetical protein